MKTQFDFETLMETCLLPQSQLASDGRSNTDVLSSMSKTVLATLKQYKHFNDYVRYYNIELPLEDDDQDDLRESAGIRALKSLQVICYSC